MPVIHLKKPFRSGSHRSRRNPEFAKKTQAILKDIEGKPGKKIVKTAAGDVLFDQGLAVLPDDGRADDIYGELMATEMSSGGTRRPDRYAFVRKREGHKKDRIHNYFFGSWPEMPWKRGKE